MKPTFQHWRPFLDVSGFTTPSSSDDYFRSQYARFVMNVLTEYKNGNEYATSVVHDQIFSRLVSSEAPWHRDGRPYFKVWPAICEAMKYTTLEFSAEAFDSPYTAFALMLPKELYRLPTAFVFAYKSEADYDSHNVSQHLGELYGNGPLGKQVSERFHELWEKQRAEHGDFNMVVTISWHDVDAGISQTNLPVYNGETLEESLRKIAPADPGEECIGLTTEQQHDIIRIAIGTCMFGIDRHELVLPDIQRDVIERRFPKSRGKKDIVNRLAIERELAKNRGWLVGSEIDLPAAHVIYKGDRPGPKGGELEFGHMRRGHMRLQPCGEGSKKRKLIFVPPTIVRPDLPIRTTHGYRIRGHEHV